MDGCSRQPNVALWNRNLKVQKAHNMPKRSRWVCNEERRPRPTEHQHESLCAVPDKDNQQWRAADAFLHPCLDEPHDGQNEQEALENEAGHPGIT